MKRPSHAELVRALLAWEEVNMKLDNCMGAYEQYKRLMKRLKQSEQALRRIARRLRKPEGRKYG